MKMFKQKAQAPLDRKAYLTGQATTEYLIIFALLVALTLLSLSAFYPKVQSVGEDLFKKATEGILK